MIRLVESTDYYKGMSDIIFVKYGKQTIEYEEFVNRLNQMQKEGTNYFIYEENGKVVGFVKYILELKMSPDKKYMGHIEDLYVVDNMRNRGYGRSLTEYCFNFLKNNQCYKIVLDCSEELVPFYNKIGFYKQKVSLEYLNL
jgi:glucosamine-phosphate N-acetyltransferase